MSKLGIEILSQDVHEVVGRMPVAGNARPFGRLHGGATLVLGETLGSLAADLHAKTAGRTAVGLDVNATHHAPASGGHVIGTAVPLHLGRRVTTHEVTIRDEAGTLVTTVRITNMLVAPTAP
ncbi:MAG: hotdog fold thioesterase [Bifidobacteriaceae bacterium]|nr:hotdog fold thioesterase [Bifidobacteriaceae bacterium]